MHRMVSFSFQLDLVMTNPIKLTDPRAPLNPNSAGLAAALSLALVLGHVPIAHAQNRPTTAATPMTFNIPAQPLGQALNDLAQQAKLLLTYSEALGAKKKAPAVSGQFTAQQALDRLLRGSGLVATTEGASVLVRLASQQADESGSSSELPTVVVTGTKRNQGLQRATQSVSVLKERDTIGLESALNVVTRLPNTAQQSETFLPTIRGLNGNGVATGGGGAVTGANPRLSNYVDGVARTYGATPDGAGSFWDMAQVEVYRGSQSTLLGQNALAGAIVQTTRDPVFKDQAALQIGAHNERTTVNGAFMVNKAVNDSLAIRVTGEAINGKNPIDYSGFSGTGLSADDRDELGRVRYGRYRFKALLAPSDALTLKLTLEQERRRNPYTNDIASISSRREVVGTSYGWFDSKNEVLALNANYEISPEWIFDAVLSQQKAITKFLPPAVGNPNSAGYLNFTFDSTETALEPKLIYKARQGRTSAVVGAFFKQRDRDDLGQPGSLFALTADDEASSKSLFADATLQVSSAWDILAAARYIDDRQQRSFSAFGGALAYSFDERNRVFLPKIGVTWNASTDAAFSLVAYKGYNPSGGGVSFVTRTPYQYRKESAQTVELVARTQWLDRRLTANANLFFTRLKDLQVNGIGPAGPLDGINVNIARTRTRGIEVEVAYLPDARSQFGMALGLLDTRIVDFGSAANNASNGNELGLSPRATLNLNGSFELLPHLTIGGDVALVSKRHSDYNNRPTDRVGGYGIANINLRHKVGKVTLTGYVNNVFDKFVQFARFESSNQAYVNDPRTIGVNLKAEF
jgi:iron complex outermembrane recepter protein